MTRFFGAREYVATRGEIVACGEPVARVRARDCKFLVGVRCRKDFAHPEVAEDPSFYYFGSEVGGARILRPDRLHDVGVIIYPFGEEWDEELNMEVYRYASLAGSERVVGWRGGVLEVGLVVGDPVVLRLAINVFGIVRSFSKSRHRCLIQLRPRPVVENRARALAAYWDTMCKDAEELALEAER